MSRSAPVSPCRLQLTPPRLPLRRDLGPPPRAPPAETPGAASGSAVGLAGSGLAVAPPMKRSANSSIGAAGGSNWRGHGGAAGQAVRRVTCRTLTATSAERNSSTGRRLEVSAISATISNWAGIKYQVASTLGCAATTAAPLRQTCQLASTLTLTLQSSLSRSLSQSLHVHCSHSVALIQSLWINLSHTGCRG